MPNIFKKILGKIFVKKKIRPNINEITEKDFLSMSDEDKIILLEDEIRNVTLDGNSSIDIKFQLQNNICDILLEKGYNVTQHSIYDYTKCSDVVEAPGIRMMVGEPKEEIWTKIYW